MRLYLVFLAVIFPLYVRNRTYFGIGNHKFELFRNATVTFLTVMAVLVSAERFKKHNERKTEKLSLSLIDLSVLLLFTVMTVSFILSYDKEEALWGTSGWHMGYLTYLLFIGIYAVYSRCYQWRTADLYLFCAGCFIVKAIGIANRFGMLIIDKHSASNAFLSTIGNMNWVCGYVSAVFPLSAGLFLLNRNRKTADIFLEVDLLTGFTALLTNGSNSAYLIIMALFCCLALFSLTDYEIMKRTSAIAVLFSLSCLFLNLIRLLNLPLYEAVMVEPVNYGVMLTSGMIPYILMILSSAFMFLVFRYCSGKDAAIPEDRKTVYPVMVLPLLMFALLLVQIAPFYTFPPEFGDMRGAIWDISRYFYTELPFFRKLFGVGPDCFALYAQEDWGILHMMNMYYPNQRLTNAHSQLLTVLINNGWTGVWAYLCVISSCLYVSLSAYVKRNCRAMLLPVLCLICSTANLIVSFETVTNVPYIFIAAAVTGCLNYRS